MIILTLFLIKDRGYMINLFELTAWKKQIIGNKLHTDTIQRLNTANVPKDSTVREVGFQTGQNKIGKQLQAGKISSSSYQKNSKDRLAVHSALTNAGSSPLKNDYLYNNGSGKKPVNPNSTVAPKPIIAKPAVTQAPVATSVTKPVAPPQKLSTWQKLKNIANNMRR